MASQGWAYDPRLNRYRRPNGRFLAASVVHKLRNDYVGARAIAMADLAGEVGRRAISVQEFERGMRREIRLAFGGQYAFGRGGRNNMTATDWGNVGVLCKDQYGWLRGFTEDVKAGKLSTAQIEARAVLYAGSSVQAYERARASVFGLTLPRHPGDGSTECKANCRCHLRIAEDLDQFRVYWILDDGAAHCKDCPTLAATWAPLVIAKPKPE